MAYRVEKKDGFTLYHNENGKTIGVSSCPVIEKDGYIFKDFEGTKELLPYADWRLDAKTRAEDLAARLSVEEIAGLMMYSPHQMLPALCFGPFIGTYDGKSLEESGRNAWELTDQQQKILTEDHIRHILIAGISDAETAAKWSNEMQAYVERLPHGIPVNISSDPRHGAGKAAAEFKTQANEVSKWPEGLGLAATFDPEVCRAYAETVATEYRALGIATALSPQIDLGTEPRWMRFEDTFGCNPELVTAFAKAYCDGLQTTKDCEDGWGADSVCAMAKHWPGGGPCEGGRDAHYAYGKYAVYPGESFDVHLKPFTEGAFQLDGPTKTAASIMPYYTVSWNVDQKDGQNVGNSYSHYLIHDLLREKYGYDGVVCTDWGITADPDEKVGSFGSRCFGVESLTEAERHLRIIENGVDQFGGNSDIKPILEAYRIGCEKYGEEVMRKRFEESAKRLLKNIFMCGLYDNAYLDVEHSKQVAGCEASANRSYAGKIGTARNESDLDNIIHAKEVLKDKPVIVCMRMHHAMVMSEVEPYADAILADFGVQHEALLQIIRGMAKPQGRLPIQLPKDMETVEKHCEDKPFDLEPFTDSMGNVYDYGFGLDWNGVIE